MLRHLRLWLTDRVHRWAAHRMQRPADKWIGYHDPMDGEPVVVYWTWRIFKLWKFGALDLHWFVSSDLPACFHTHNSWSWRWILRGSYADVPARAYDADRPQPITIWRAGDMGFVAPTYAHRVQLLQPYNVDRDNDPGATTLWITGPKVAKIMLVGNGWQDIGLKPGLSPIEQPMRDQVEPFMSGKDPHAD